MDPRRLTLLLSILLVAAGALAAGNPQIVRLATGDLDLAAGVAAPADPRLVAAPAAPGETVHWIVHWDRKVTGELQTMIQEAILDRALLAPDENVPPGYEKMVEEYYRALSEDLR